MPSPFRRGSSPCPASSPSSCSLRWIRPERTAACFPAAEAGGPLPGGPPRASGRSPSGRRRCRLGQLVGFNPKGLLGAVASVRGLGLGCRRPLAAGGTGGHRRIPHGPGGAGRRSCNGAAGGARSVPGLRPAVRRPVTRTKSGRVGSTSAAEGGCDPWGGTAPNFCNDVTQRISERSIPCPCASLIVQSRSPRPCNWS